MGGSFLLSYTAVGEMMPWLLSEVDFRAKHEAGLSFSWVVVVALDGFLHQRADRFGEDFNLIVDSNASLHTEFKTERVGRTVALAGADVGGDASDARQAEGRSGRGRKQVAQIVGV